MSVVVKFVVQDGRDAREMSKHRETGRKNKKDPEKRSFHAHTVQPVSPDEMKKFLFELVM